MLTHIKDSNTICSTGYVKELFGVSYSYAAKNICVHPEFPKPVNHTAKKRTWWKQDVDNFFREKTGQEPIVE